MWKALSNFFANFFKNIVADPASTIKGVVSLASAGATCYGMATGKLPTDEMSIGVAVTLATNGIHALGTDNVTKELSPVAGGAIKLVETAASITPAVLSINDHFDAIKQQAGAAQATLQAVNEAAAVLQSLTTKESVEQQSLKFPGVV